MPRSGIAQGGRRPEAGARALSSARQQEGESPSRVAAARLVIEPNCVAAMRGGEQGEVNNQAVGDELDSALPVRRACVPDAKPEPTDRPPSIADRRPGRVATPEASTEPGQARRRWRTAVWLETAWLEAGVREEGRPIAGETEMGVRGPIVVMKRRNGRGAKGRRKEEA